MQTISKHNAAFIKHILYVLLLCLLFGATELLANSHELSFEKTKAQFQSSYGVLLDRHGQVLHQKRIDLSVHRLDWVSIEHISPALIEAIIFAEDKDFYKHHGVDWGATARASLKLMRGDKSRGASTISMQVAALIDDDLRWKSGGRSVSQKWRQMRAAKRIEKRWSKAEILEAYLNLSWFRGDLQGVNAVSLALFKKAPIALTKTEAILLASLLPSPNAQASRVAARACTHVALGFIGADCQDIKDLSFTILNQRRMPIAERPALNALAGRLLSLQAPRISTSIDGRLQHYAEALLRAQLLELEGQNVSAGAVLVLDNASGEVLAYVANAGLVESASFVDGVQAQRQAGSTLKPFLFGLAFELRYLTPASILEDKPLSLATPTGLYAPQNYDNDFKGPVSARVALAGSLNIPTVRVLTLTGVDAFWQQLRHFGFNSLTENADFYGYSLALGSADISLWSLANAYRALANKGEYTDAHFGQTLPSNSRSVMSPQAAFMVSDILSDRGARAITFDWESPLSTPFWSAVKTGTSKDMRDNWCVGFSERYTVAVWVGNMDGSPMRDVSGITGAAPIWAQMMRELEGGRVSPVLHKQPPAGLIQQPVRFNGLNEADRNEWFLNGTEMSEVVYTPDAATRIQYPADGTIMALDPDIPFANQKVQFKAEVPDASWQWWLNGKPVGPAQPYLWSPEMGRHILELRDERGLVKDSVSFHVRGQRRK